MASGSTSRLEVDAVTLPAALKANNRNCPSPGALWLDVPYFPAMEFLATARFAASQPIVSLRLVLDIAHDV